MKPTPSSRPAIRATASVNAAPRRCTGRLGTAAGSIGAAFVAFEALDAA